MIIWAGGKGYLDDIPTAMVSDFEQEFFKFMESDYPDVGHKIASEKIISEDTEKNLTAGADAYKAKFMADKGLSKE